MMEPPPLNNVVTRAPLRATYVPPHHQCPTTVTVKAARRLALLALARTHRSAIVEVAREDLLLDGRLVDATPRCGSRARGTGDPALPESDAGHVPRVITPRVATLHD